MKIHVVSKPSLKTKTHKLVKQINIWEKARLVKLHLLTQQQRKSWKPYNCGVCQKRHTHLQAAVTQITSLFFKLWTDFHVKKCHLLRHFHTQ